MQSRRLVMARSDMPRLSQETLTIVGASIALAALILTSSAGIRGEIRDVRAEARADREAFQSHIRDVRAEARADREAFQSHIIRLTEQQGVLRARLDGLGAPPATDR